jgi:hypothetical protein
MHGLVNLLPQRITLLGWQGLENLRRFRRMQIAEQGAQAVCVAALERIDNIGKRLLHALFIRYRHGIRLRCG